MRRILIFLLILLLAAGSLVYASAGLFELEDDLTITQEVLFGDPDALRGQTARIHYNGGDHLHWYTDYSFGAEPVYSTEFQFVQERQVPENPVSRSLEIFGYQGGGTSISGGHFELADTLLGRMARDVALQTPNGETFSMNLPLRDYTDTYPLMFDLGFSTEEMGCWLSTGMELDPETDEIMNRDREWAEEFSGLFRFPVPQDAIFQLEVSTDEEGNLYSVLVNPLNVPDCGFRGTATEDGLYLVPYFRDPKGQPLEGSYPDGMGLYRIPWKTVNTWNRRTKDGETVTQQEVLPDLSRIENICPLDSRTDPIDFRISGDGTTAWMLSREHDTCVLTVVDLTRGTIRSRIELLPAGPNPGSLHTTYANGYLVAADCGKLALVDLAGDGHLEFFTDAGAAEEFLERLYLGQTDFCLGYDGTQLVLVNQSNVPDYAFWAAAFTADGLQFLGRYTSSFDSLAFWGYSFAVSNFYNPITLQ